MTTAASLYRQVLGSDFHLLPAELQAFHSIGGHETLSGQCSVAAPGSLLASLLRRVLGLPDASPDTPFSFDLDATPNGETWRRHFAGRTMTSRMRVDAAGLLVERLGPVSLHFRLDASPARLDMLLERIALCGIPFPRIFRPSVTAVETATPGKLHFTVSARLPLVGTLATYRGFLNIVMGARP